MPLTLGTHAAEYSCSSIFRFLNTPSCSSNFTSSAVAPSDAAMYCGVRPWTFTSSVTRSCIRIARWLPFARLMRTVSSMASAVDTSRIAHGTRPAVRSRIALEVRARPARWNPSMIRYSRFTRIG